jgi:ATP-dependent Lhr-like helicase
VAEECAHAPDGAEQLVAYVAATQQALGAVPTTRRIIAERFFDEAGGMQLIVHAPFGGRINRAFGLALRKRFCVTFDFELQAAATDDGLVLSLGEQHSFPLEAVFTMVRRATLADDLTQAALASPLFTNRWRWNATRSLALLRHEGGRRVPMPLQRMRADDLLAAVFPGQVACQDNVAGPIPIPDHPLVRETIDNCLHEAMDLDGLAAVLSQGRARRGRDVAIDTVAPSPMSHEIWNSNPYTFLDDAPLEGAGRARGAPPGRARAGRLWALSNRRPSPSAPPGLAPTCATRAGCTTCCCRWGSCRGREVEERRGGGRSPRSWSRRAARRG